MENTTKSRAPANAGNIISISEGDLFKIMDVAERSVDALETELPKIQRALGEQAETEEGQEAKSAFDDLADVRSILNGVQENLRKVDGMTDRDDKIWRSPEDGQDTKGWYSNTYKQFGEVFGVAFRSAKDNYQGLPEGYTRAADQKGGTDNIGGVLVPDITYDRIAYILREKSLLRMLGTTVPMTSDTTKVPMLPNGPTTYYVGEGDALGPGTGSTSALTFATGLSLEAKTLMAINIVSGELDDDSLAAYEPFWALVFSDAFALKENKAMFSETAADAGSAFTGIVQSVAGEADANLKHEVTLSGSHFSTVTFDKLVETQFAINENALDGGVWAMNKAAFRYIAALTDNQGAPIFNTSYQALNQVAPRFDPKNNRATVLLGDPCFITQALPGSSQEGDASLGFIVYGDPRFHFFGDRKQMAIAWSDEAAFTSGARVMRARERYASKTIVNDAFAVVKTGS